jgi:hypothetical protein
MSLIVPTTLLNNILPMLHAAGTANLVWWTDGQLHRWFADHVKRHAEAHGVFVLRDATATLVAGTATYDAPADHLDTIHVAITSGASGDDALDLESDDSLLLESGDEILLESATVTSSAAGLVASSTTELEALDDAYATTQGTPTRWYPDRIGANMIGLYPVPSASGATLEVIYHGFPCDLSSGFFGPAVAGNYLELAVFAEAVGCESDGQMVESAANARQVMSLMDEVTQMYYGRTQ